jgi:predicted TIM-barrel fold metal-dependent hydrolase
MNICDFQEIRSLCLFDSHCRLGPSELTTADAPVTVSQLIEEMDRCGIAESLLWHAWAEGYSPTIGNGQLLKEISGEPRLHGCWVILPPHTFQNAEPRSLVAEIGRAGVRAVKMLPRKHRFSLSDWSTAELLKEVEEQRLPLFLDFGRQHWFEDVVDYDSVFRICKQFPKLPVVLVREGIGSTRFLYPLFEKLDNFHIEISYYQSPGGLRDITERFGARHLLFGTGLPTFAAGPPILMLSQSELSTEDKKKIAGDNLRRLLRG